MNDLPLGAKCSVQPAGNGGGAGAGLYVDLSMLESLVGTSIGSRPEMNSLL